MIARLRFRLYRWLLGTVTAKGFKDQVVLPLEVPSKDHVDVEPLAEELPRLRKPRNFPSTDHAKNRLKGIKLRGLLIPIVSMLPAKKTAPIATDLDGLLADIYPERYRKIWPHPPVVAPELEADDMLAALAVSGPLAMYLTSGSVIADGDRPEGVTADDYVIDMRLFDAYPPKPGLLAPGGLAVFSADGDRLRTRGVIYEGRLHEPGDASFERAGKVLLCALNTHMTTLLHNSTYHIGYVTPMAVASTNELDPDHPIRRLLHPAFHTTLIGNYELAKFQLVGEGSFATRLFSHDYSTLTTIIDDHLRDFRIADLDPEVEFARSGLDGSPVALPHWDDRLALWTITREYAERYVGQYYADDGAVGADTQLTAWAGALDRLLPSGLYDEDGYLTAGEPLDAATLARVCATFLHISSATHDVVNNAVWDYVTLNYAIPTVVPESLEPQDVRLSFDLLNTYIGTWKEYNMLVDGISVLALDADGRKIMDDYIARLKDRQREMDQEPHEPGRIYPNALNPSVSN